MNSANHTGGVVPKPVFVVGMNGSGTGVLVRSLNQHPNLYAFPGETKILPHYFKNDGQFGDLEQDECFRILWDKVRNDYAFTGWNGGRAIPLPENWRKYTRELAAIFDSVFGYFAAREGKNRWCEKTPMHVLHLPLLQRHYPEAKFLHIIRDGRDAAASFHRRWKYQPELSVLRWRNALHLAREEAQSLPDNCYFELKYEDLMRDPANWLGQVCEFIGEPFQDAMLQPSWPNKKVRLASGFVANSGNWKSYFDVKMITALEDIAGKTLSDNGYEVSADANDHDPSKWLCRYWTVCDRSRKVLQLVKSAFLNPKLGPLQSLKGLAGQLGKALRQISSQR